MVQKNKWEDEKEATRAASCASASLQRVKESQWQHRQERKDAVSGQRDGNQREDYREGKHEHTKEKERGQCSLPERAEAKGNGALGVKSPLFHRMLGKTT